GGHEERPRPQFLKEAGDRLENDGNIGNAPAAGREGDAVSRLDFPGQLQRLQGGAHAAGHILQPRPLKLLTNPKHLRIWHVKLPGFSFPGSAWERTAARLRLASPHPAGAQRIKENLLLAEKLSYNILVHS